MISKSKSQRGRIGTAYHIEKSHTKRKVNCKHYDEEDGSCYEKSIIIWQVGYDICKKCKCKLPIDKEETPNKKSQNKGSKKINNNSNIENIQINRYSDRVRQVLKIANNHCELCNNKCTNLDIYIIDKTKSSDDIDSILNIIALCPSCKSEVYKNKEKYMDSIKSIINERLNKIV